MSKKQDFDAIVIGAGSGGLSSAIALSTIGKKVLLIEKGEMGGECTNTGCIPSKSLIYHSHQYADAKQHAGKTDLLQAYHSNIFHLVRKKIRAVRAEESEEELSTKHGITIRKGKASFVDAQQVQISSESGKETFTAAKIIIATGSSARRIEIPGLESERLLTNENLFELQEIPKSLLIIGGGAIACEMAEAFTLLGTEVSIAIRGSRLLAKEEPEVSQVVQDAFEHQGIRIFQQTNAQKAEGSFVLAVEDRDGERVQHKIPAEKVLLGIGRVPNIEGLDLEKAGVQYNEQGIIVNKHFRTSQRHILAIGDVSSSAKFTHVADDQGRHLMWKTVFPWISTPNIKPLPKVTFLRQEVASVGLSFQEACERFGKESVIKITMPFNNTDRAKTDQLQRGIAIVIAKRLSGTILGVSLVGEHAGELISVFTLAMQNKISLYKLNQMIVPYPVLGRLYKKLSDAYIGETVEHLKPDVIRYCRAILPKVLLRLVALGLLGFGLWYALEQGF